MVKKYTVLKIRRRDEFTFFVFYFVNLQEFFEIHSMINMAWNCN